MRLLVENEGDPGRIGSQLARKFGTCLLMRLPGVQSPPRPIASVHPRFPSTAILAWAKGILNGG
jgi:hypothetical protein